MDAVAIHVFDAAPRPFRKDNAAGKKATVWIQGEDEPVELTPVSRRALFCGRGLSSQLRVEQPICFSAETNSWCLFQISGMSEHNIAVVVARMKNPHLRIFASQIYVNEHCWSTTISNQRLADRSQKHMQLH